MKKGMLTRILVGMALAALFVGLWFAIGFFGKSDKWYSLAVQVAAFAIVNVLCVYEMRDIMKAKGRKVTAIPYITAAALPFVKVLEGGGIGYTLCLLLCTALCSVAVNIFNKDKSYDDLFAELAIYAYPILPLMCLFMVCTRESVFMRLWFMLLTFACPLFGDTFAYFCGMAFGRKKFCEHISPKKTWAGAIGGLIGAAIAGVCCTALRPMIAHIFSVPMQNHVGESILYAALTGMLLGAAGQIGDLFASCIKRWAGVKDFGNIFPGHGGMLDRIDSVLFCAPFVAILIYCL